MERREFLIGTVGVVGAAGLVFSEGQAPAGPPGQTPPAGQGAGRGGRGGGRGGPANVPAAKLAYSNLDFGGARRFRNQQQLHDAIKGLMKRSSGSMHIKSSPD